MPRQSILSNKAFHFIEGFSMRNLLAAATGITAVKLSTIKELLDGEPLKVCAI